MKPSVNRAMRVSTRDQVVRRVVNRAVRVSTRVRREWQRAHLVMRVSTRDQVVRRVVNRVVRVKNLEAVQAPVVLAVQDTTLVLERPAAQNAEKGNIKHSQVRGAVQLVQ